MNDKILEIKKEVTEILHLCSVPEIEEKYLLVLDKLNKLICNQ